MYLYSWASEAIETWDYDLNVAVYTGYTYSLGICVPDCPSVNMNMQNNPHTGKCDFMGQFC